MKSKARNSLSAVVGGLFLMLGSSAFADELNDMVEASRTTFNNFMSDTSMKWAQDNMEKAQGLIIVPKYTKAGFIVGGAGGDGVMLARSDDGTWSGPAFYQLTAASVGLQAGIDVAEVLMVVNSKKGMEALLGGGMKLGADVSVTAGPVGAGTSAATADVLAYSKSKGLFVGIAFDGSNIQPSEDKNSAYYGEQVTPADILIDRKVSNPAAKDLLKDVAFAEELEVQQ
ncbi:MAG: lipid-binding SYLF domain-containing protein [Pseudomonadota bacterium]